MKTKPDPTKYPLGGVAWLRSIAADKAEMLHALGSIDDETAREEALEIQGLRDAADRMERTEKAFEELLCDCVPSGSQLALLGLKAPKRATYMRARKALA